MAAQLEARLAELEAERGRVRDALARFGEALAATHDAKQLLRIVAATAAEATSRAAAGSCWPTAPLSRAGTRTARANG